MPDFFVDPNIAKAKTLNTAFYTDVTIFERCKELLFASLWQFAGSEESVNEPGDVAPVTLLPGYLDEPLLLTHDKGGEIRLLSNVCTHRGNLVVNKACKLHNLRCDYHGRMFGLDGKLSSMQEFKEVENFPAITDNLHQLPLFKWVDGCLQH